MEADIIENRTRPAATTENLCFDVYSLASSHEIDSRVNELLLHDLIRTRLWNLSILCHSPDIV